MSFNCSWRMIARCSLRGMPLLAAIIALGLILLTGCTLLRKQFGTWDGDPKGDALYEPDLKLEVPKRLQDGKATLKEAFSWCRKVHWLACPTNMMRFDMDQDGKGEILIFDERYAGTGGNTYLVFQQTEQGLRFYDAIFFRGIRCVANTSNSPRQIVTTSWGGSGECRAALHFLEPSGFREVASVRLPCGDGATDNPDKRHGLLGDSHVLSQQIVEQIFNTGLTTNEGINREP